MSAERGFGLIVDTRRIADALEELVEIRKLELLARYREAILVEKYAGSRVYGPERATYESLDSAFGRRLEIWSRKYAEGARIEPESDDRSQSE